MPNWEYLVLDRWMRKFETGSLDTGGLMSRYVWYWVGTDGTTKGTLQQTLNHLGEQGWELHSIIPLSLERGASAGVTSNLQVILRRTKAE